MFEKFALFIHIIGALGLFAAMALQISSLAAFRRAASIDEVRGIISGASKLLLLAPISAILILLTGPYLMYLASKEHYDVGWAGIALAAFIIIGIAGGITSRRDARIIQAKVDESDNRFTDELHSLIQDAKLLTIPLVSVWTLSAVVVLMVFKPDVAISVLITTAGIAIGFAHAALVGRNQLKL
jgi:hypothetical protein